MQADILHLQASLEWSECKGPPVTILEAQSVCLDNKVYVKGGTVLNKRADARLYIYTPATDTWETMDTPVYGFALTTYHSQLVLVGGREYVNESVEGQPSKKLWTLSEDGQWQEVLPPMETEFCSGLTATSHGDYLLVIVGSDVNVYDGRYWRKGQNLPEKLRFINSAVHDSHWYLMGVTGAYYASIDSLIASSLPSQPLQPSLWQKVSDVPGGRCYPANLGTTLIAVGQSAVYGYLPSTQSLLYVGHVPGTPHVPCAVALPSNEVMIIKGTEAFKGTLKSKIYQLQNMHVHDPNFKLTVA